MCETERLGLSLLNPDVADQSDVIHMKKFLSLDEINCIRQAAESLKKSGADGHSDGASNYTGPWDTLYLQQGSFFQQAMPNLHRRLCDLVTEVDHTHFGMLEDAGEEIGDGVNARTVELHEYGARARNICDVHYDTGSMFTVDVMLSDTADFQGGHFFTHSKDPDDIGPGVLRRHGPHEFEQGDALVFISHKHHSVQPVTSGTRMVLVLEFWEGSQCRAAHRCMNPNCGLLTSEN
eukprot:TRINITY_DN92481_c0_g1_i1.p1 TRINITY_DN92481_c0_g1~~TRINITY_DN92481_c0_g1_i1.p1  ORF type:complete len:252 (-),score=33.49 TRINITY_DN92481_c0_g1_i1:292-996(-)